MRLYLDTSMVIHLVERSVPEQEAILIAALNERAARKPLLCWTELTRLECRVKPLRERDKDLLSCYDMFFSQPAASHVPIDKTVFDLATELRARHRLKTPDALHLAAAIEAGCEEFWTNDHRLDAAASGYLHTVTL
ncbi:MAG: type II toxin-antitoxin system VapC family toxin [Azoarcus sp.]|jgi:predicted nucleic acid-binding protein|nr:type II toxin-antitoxin system VapC family toxin [Azoarcus sp.]